MRSICLPFEVKEHMIQLYQQGRSATSICDTLGISRQTLYKWLQRYEAQGPSGLQEQSRRPHHSPRQISASVEQRIVTLRQRERIGPARIAFRLKHSRSTVHRVLKAHQLNHLHPKCPPKVAHRYEKDYPGELLHLDIKDLVPLRRGTPKEYQFAIIDDFCREGFSTIFPHKDTQSATDFLLQALAYYPYALEAILTDNAATFTMRYAFASHRQTRFEKACLAQGIKHRLIRPYHPQSNGKVERFFRTVQEECYDAVRLRSSQQRHRVLQEFLQYYNHKRQHLGIRGLTPVQKRDAYFETVSDVSD